MHTGLRKAFEAEMAAAAGLYVSGDLAQAFGHLERAHVLGQRNVVPHVVTHYWMLKVAVKRRSLPEVAGQAIRIVLGALGSAVGVVPAGNTGGTDIGMFKRLPVDPAIEELLK